MRYILAFLILKFFSVYHCFVLCFFFFFFFSPYHCFALCYFFLFFFLLWGAKWYNSCMFWRTVKLVSVNLKPARKRRKLWKTGGWAVLLQQCHPNSTGSLVIARTEWNHHCFCCFFCVVGYSPNWGKRLRYIDRIGRVWQCITHSASTYHLPAAMSYIVSFHRDE